MQEKDFNYDTSIKKYFNILSLASIYNTKYDIIHLYILFTGSKILLNK